MKTHFLRAAAAALACTALLGGCFSGGDPVEGMPAAEDKVPESATSSSQAYTRYAASLAASETREPLDVSGVVPPTSETDEPEPVS